ncbi:MAG: EamA family transporter, partial [Planctomycetales bacterium]|nr:EamA family transporter [Planctomycetales bacterium]NIP68229.1 EamA family transporter [Planctomycetales bacterium]
GLIVTGAVGLPFAIIAVLLKLIGVGFGARQGGLIVMPMMFPAGVEVAMNLIGII